MKMASQEVRIELCVRKFLHRITVKFAHMIIELWFLLHLHIGGDGCGSLMYVYQLYAVQKSCMHYLFTVQYESGIYIFCYTEMPSV